MIPGKNGMNTVIVSNGRDYNPTVINSTGDSNDNDNNNESTTANTKENDKE